MIERIKIIKINNDFKYHFLINFKLIIEFKTYNNQ